MLYAEACSCLPKAPTTARRTVHRLFGDSGKPQAPTRKFHPPRVRPAREKKLLRSLLQKSLVEISRWWSYQFLSLLLAQLGKTTMSSFFTKSSSQRKRKATDAPYSAAKKRNTAPAAGGRPAGKPGRKPRDESVSGSDYDDDESIASGDNVSEAGSDASSGAEGETAAEKRLRLAERYLDNIREEIDEAGFDAADIDRDIIASRLQEDVAESKGKVYRTIANDYDFQSSTQKSFRSNHKTITGVATHAPYVYTVSSDMVVMKWEIPEQGEIADVTTPENQVDQRKPKFHPKKQLVQRSWSRGKRSRRKDPSYIGHTDAIYCVACSPDGKFLATGGADNRIVIWDANTMKPLKLFPQHRDSILSLAFRRGSNQLFSASADRTVKIWSLDELAYVETLFGHQDHITDVDALGEEKCVTVGSRDRTARLWKVVEESQLVFRGGGEKSKGRSRNNVQDAEEPEQVSYAEQTIDRISLISNDTFITGSSNGSLSLWSIHKKKPVCVYPLAHGLEAPPAPEDIAPEADEAIRNKIAAQVKPRPRWITALRAIPYSDLVLSASWDGTIRAWRIAEPEVGGKGKTIEPVGILGKVNIEEEPDVMEDESPKRNAIDGFINDLSVFEKGNRGKDGLCVVAAIGQQHRLGKWAQFAGAKNGAVLFDIPKKQNAVEDGSSEDEEFHSMSD